MHQSQEQIIKEQELIEKSRSNPQFFAPVYEKYHNRIYSFIYRRTEDRNLTSDLTSQVFLKAITNLSSYQFRGTPFSAWLFRIAVNEVNDFYRRSKKDRVVSFEEENLKLLYDSITEGESMLETNFNEEKVLSSLTTLKQDEIQFIELRFFEDRSFKEIGAILNITENNAKVKTYRILDKLKKNLNIKSKND